MARALAMVHEKDPREALLEEIGGAVRNITVMGARVLVASYVRPEKTKSGIFLPDKTRDEDKHQGKTGLVLAMGPLAFTDDAHHTWGEHTAKVGDWVMYNIGDTRRLMIGSVECRLLEDVHVQAIVTDPDQIY